MTIAFVSNYYNHHQAPFSEAINRLPEVEYHFIETGTISEERRKLGYEMKSYPEFVMTKEENDRIPDEINRIIDNADIVVFGSAPNSLLKNRHKKGSVVFRYSERPFKHPVPKWKIPPTFFYYYYLFGRHHNEYLLCASAFTPYDFSITRNYIGKTYKWGYFPETKRYDIDHMIEQKKKGSILWAGRLITWKHPEIPILLAEKLKKDGFEFDLNIIGSGELFDSMKELINNKYLADKVHLLGSMSPDKVREYMERSEIFLSTSDRNEGWGAVINEAMNSGCTVVASDEVGAVPYLIEDGVNGIVFRDGSFESVYVSVSKLLSDSDLCRRLGKAAYYTITDCWNAEEAARRFYILAQEIVLKGTCNQFESGPCSKAEIIKDGWFEN